MLLSPQVKLGSCATDRWLPHGLGRGTLGGSAARRKVPWSHPGGRPSGGHTRPVLCSAEQSIDRANDKARQGTASGIVAGESVGQEQSQRDFYQINNLYDTISGQDNIHHGFYPHLARGGRELVVLDNVQASMALTQRMIALGGIDRTSKVLDLGCGKGLSCSTIAKLTGASCVGVDLTPKHIERANELAATTAGIERGQLTFIEGSFTELPSEALALGPFSHVFSQVAFCHVHAELPAILAQVKKALAPGGAAVINDMLGASAPPASEGDVLDAAAVYRRLHFEVLHGHQAWRRIVEEAGFTLEHYENWDVHMLKSYEDRRDKADALGAEMADGTPLATNFEQTVRAVRARQIGMNFAILTVD